jgi:hypothetical protein
LIVRMIMDDMDGLAHVYMGLDAGVIDGDGVT